MIEVRGCGQVSLQPNQSACFSGRCSFERVVDDNHTRPGPLWCRHSQVCAEDTRRRDRHISHDLIMAQQTPPGTGRQPTLGPASALRYRPSKTSPDRWRRRARCLARARHDHDGHPRMGHHRPQGNSRGSHHRTGDNMSTFPWRLGRRWNPARQSLVGPIRLTLCQSTMTDHRHYAARNPEATAEQDISVHRRTTHHRPGPD